MSYVASLIAIQWKARHLVPPVHFKCISIQRSEFVWNDLGLHIREEASLNFPRISLVLVLSLASCTTIWGTGFIHYRGRPNYFDLFSPSSGTAEYGWTVSVEYKYNLHISAFARAHVSRWLDIRRVIPLNLQWGRSGWWWCWPTQTPAPPPSLLWTKSPCGRQDICAQIAPWDSYCFKKQENMKNFIFLRPHYI